MQTLKHYGLTPFFSAQAALYPDETIGRVISQGRDIFKVITEDAEFFAEVSGKCRSLGTFPAVGDFVMLDRASGENGHGQIQHVLARKSVFERKAAGQKGTQVVAANIDIVFICSSLNNDFNLRRLERYLSIAWNSGALPVVVLTKSDICDDTDEKLAEASDVAIGADVLVTSGFIDDTLVKLRAYLKEDVTAAFIGSSGVGKSTLINALAGDSLLKTAAIRQDDDKGRHTTTRRELIALPQGGVVIDTPGMREIGLDSADLAKAFSDIDALAAQCRFRDCTHKAEPGCAVRAAVESGALDENRLESYLKLKKEARYDGLNSRQIEKEKITEMFSDFGGIKNARKFAKEKNKH